MYTERSHAGLGILPVIVTTAVNLLVPAIEKLFGSTTSYSFPAMKKQLDTWAGVVNLDPTFLTAYGHWAWANLRCVAGDQNAAADVQTALQLFQRKQIGPMQIRITPDGLVPDNFSPTCPFAQADAVAYALSAIRVLMAGPEKPATDQGTPTTDQGTSNKGLYSDTLPPPLPPIPVPTAAASSSGSQPKSGLFDGLSPTTLAIGGGLLVAVLLLRKR